MIKRKYWILGGVAFASVLFLVLWLILVDIVTIKGNELGVQETWNAGVIDQVYPPGTYFLFPGVGKRMYTYTMSPQVFVMNDDENDRRSGGRPHDVFIAKASDNQQMKMHLALQWHFDPAILVTTHKLYHSHNGTRDWDGLIEDTLIRQVLMRIVNSEATKYKAIDAYSGEGFVALQNAVFQGLTDKDGELRSHGIIIENFVIEKIELDPEYIGEINRRQVAQQRTLRAQEEEKAALAEAARAQAEARADFERQVVAAERDKKKAVLESEGAAEQQINAATAAAEQVRLAASAQRDAAMLEAEAIIALGEAKAQAKQLELSAWAAPGAENFVQVEIAKNMAEAFKNIQGYLPSDMSITMLSENFLNSVRNLMRPAPTK